MLLGGETETQIGTPLVNGAAVAAEIVEQGKAKKIIVFKKKRRKGYHKKQGHRQLFTALKITENRAGTGIGSRRTRNVPQKGPRQHS